LDATVQEKATARERLRNPSLEERFARSAGARVHVRHQRRQTDQWSCGGFTAQEIGHYRHLESFHTAASAQMKIDGTWERYLWNSIVTVISTASGWPFSVPG
jgi:hypothetical protein